MSVCECFVCGRKFQFGTYEFDGRHIETWEVDICRPCIRANYDGIDLDEYPRLKKHLEDKIWLVIPINSFGLFDIPTTHGRSLWKVDQGGGKRRGVDVRYMPRKVSEEINFSSAI